MKNWSSITIIIGAMLSSIASFAQIPGAAPYSTNIDTIYYPFYEEVQMIEIDYLHSYWRKIAYLEQTQPRGMPHHMTEGPPQPNVYLFRNRNGKIEKVFNSVYKVETWNAHFKNIPFFKAEELSQQSAGSTDGALAFSKARRLGSHSAGGFKGFYKVQKNPFARIGFHNGILTVNELGLIDSLGNMVIPQIYSDILPLNDKLLVRQSDKVGIIDKSNQTLLPVRYEHKGQREENLLVFWLAGKIVKLYLIKEAKLIDIDHYDEIHHLDKLAESRITTFVKEGRWGFLNYLYQEVIPPIYDVCEFYPLTRQRKRVSRGGKWGYLNPQAEEIIPCIYTYAEGFDKNGIALVQLADELYCINEDAERQANCVLRPRWQSLGNPQDDLPGIIVRSLFSDRRYGLMHKVTGHAQLPLIYDQIVRFEHERFYRVQKNKKWGILDTNLQVVLPFEYDKIHRFDGALAMVVRGGKFGTINKQFEIVIPCEFQELTRYDQNHFVYRTEKGVGLFNAAGKLLLPAIYQSLSGFSEAGFILVQQNDRYGLMNLKLETIIPIAFEGLGESLINERVWFKAGEKYGYLDAKGSVVIPADFDRVRAFQQKITGVQKGTEWYFIDINGKRINAKTYDLIGWDWGKEGLLQVQKSGKWGRTNFAGVEVIPCIYDAFVGYNSIGRYFRVRLGRETFKIDFTGNRLK